MDKSVAESRFARYMLQTYPTTSVQCSPNSTIRNRYHFSKFINILIRTLRKHLSSSTKLEHIAFKLNPILNNRFYCEALVGNISIWHIVTALSPWKWISVSFWSRNEAVHLLILWRAMPLSVYHIISRKCHSSLLVMARGVINVFGTTRFKYFCLDSESSTLSPSLW